MQVINMDFKNNNYKLKGQRNFRNMYNKNGNISKELAKLIKENPSIELPDSFKFLYNPKTQRFILKEKVFDMRYKSQNKLKSKYKNYYINNNYLEQDIKYLNILFIDKYEIRGSKLKSGDVKLYIHKKGTVQVRFESYESKGAKNYQGITYLDTQVLEKQDEQVRKLILNTFSNIIDYDDAPEFIKKDYNHYDIIKIQKQTKTPWNKSKKNIRPVDEKMYYAKFKIDNMNINYKFQDSGNRRCVPEILHQMFCNKNLERPLKLSLQEIGYILNQSDNDLSQGYNTLQIENFCIKYRIPLYAIDINEKIFHSYMPEKKNKHFPCLCYINTMEHMYVCTDKRFLNKINSFTRKEHINNNIICENIQKETYYDINDPNVIIHDCDSLYDIIVETIEKGIIPNPKQILCSNGNIKCLKIDTMTHLANTEFDTVMQYIDFYNKKFAYETPLKFSNQNVISIAKKLFKDLYPNHIQSVFHTNIQMKTNGNLVRDFNTTIPELNTFGIDINKCRLSQLKYNKLGAYKVYNITDNIVPYTGGDLKDGYYYIITKPCIPFIYGNGWYSNGLLEKMAGKIDYEITHEYISTYTYPSNYFDNFFNVMIQFPEFKFMGNAFIGCLGQSILKSSKLSYETNQEKVINYYFNETNNETEINITPIGNCFQVETVKKVYKDSHDIPIFNQILENEWLSVYELIEKVKHMSDFRLISVRTDEVIFQSTETDITGMVFDNKIGGYKKGKTRIVKKLNEIKNDTLLDYEDTPWNIFPENEPTKLIDTIIKNNTGFLITGYAGTGKSYLTKLLIKELVRLNRKISVLAPTNTAAINIQGQTIHKFMGINMENQVCKKYVKRFCSYEYIIVDEISMVNSHIYQMFQYCKKKNRNLKFILVGDFHQLPPVMEESIDHANSHVLKYLCDFNKIELTVNKRSDSVMFDLSLDAYDTGHVNAKDFGNFEFKDAIRHLCYTNAKRKSINSKIMKGGESGGVFIKATDYDYKENPYCQDVYLKIGTPVMSCKNDIEYDMVNNEEFEIIALDSCMITMISKLTGQTLQVKTESFCSQFVVCYAMTVHKAQGQTWNFKYMIHETNQMSNKMLYTALTRTTNKDLICIKESNKNLTSHYTDEFYKNKIENYTKQDKSRHKKTDITIQDLKGIVKKYDNKCYNCVIDLVDTTATFDRQNNNLGHVKGNLKLCCFKCNTKKINLYTC